jgi:hypothetical protein
VGRSKWHAPRAGITVEARCEQLGCSLSAIDATARWVRLFLPTKFDWFHRQSHRRAARTRRRRHHRILDLFQGRRAADSADDPLRRMVALNLFCQGSSHKDAPFEGDESLSKAGYARRARLCVKRCFTDNEPCPVASSAAAALIFSGGSLRGGRSRNLRQLPTSRDGGQSARLCRQSRRL